MRPLVLLLLVLGCGDDPMLPIVFEDAGRPDVPSICGDGVVTQGEQCDDGNRDGHDDCVRCTNPGALILQHEFERNFGPLLPLPNGTVVVGVEGGLALLRSSLDREPTLFWEFPEGELVSSATTYEDDVLLITINEDDLHFAMRIATNGVVLWRQEYPGGWSSSTWSIASRSGQQVAIAGEQHGVPHLWRASPETGLVSWSVEVSEDRIDRVRMTAAVAPDGQIAVDVRESLTAFLHVFDEGGTELWNRRGPVLPETTSVAFTDDGRELIWVGYFTGNIARIPYGVVRWYNREGTLTSELEHAVNRGATTFRHAAISGDGAVVVHARRGAFGYTRALLFIRDGRVIREMGGPEDSYPGRVAFNGVGRVLAMARGVLSVYDW
jgi:hypothetical protein